ncbi:MAG: hypothetical protein AABZ64_15235 [Nitrospinota bacterium]
MAAAFVFVFIQRLTVSDVASFVLYGDPDPYVSPEREKELEKSFRGMIQKEFGSRRGKVSPQ